MGKLLLVDGNSIANRAFYALPFLTNKEGKPSGAVYGFANILIKLLQSEKPSHLVVAFDHARRTFRNDLYADYKMQRKPTPVELRDQFPLIKEMLSTMGIKYIEIPNIEADDIIGSVAKLYQGDKIILSGDRDLLQLIDDHTTVWLTKKGVSELDKVDEARLDELFGLKPYQIIELKALMGDASDNIPGVKGVGEKTAINLLSQYQNVANIYENIDKITGKLKEKLIEDKEMAFISKQLATINTACPLDVDFEECGYKLPFNSEAYEFFKKMDFSSLIKNQTLFDIEAVQRAAAKKIASRVLTTEILLQMTNGVAQTFCYDLANMKFLHNDVIYYLEKNFSMFEDELKFEDVCTKLKDVFENENIVKITANAKNDMHLLDKLGIKLNNFFDLSIAEYLINAGNKSREFEVELNEYLNRKAFLEQEIKDNKLSFVYEGFYVFVWRL